MALELIKKTPPALEKADDGIAKLRAQLAKNRANKEVEEGKDPADIYLDSITDEGRAKNKWKQRLEIAKAKERTDARMAVHAEQMKNKRDKDGVGSPENMYPGGVKAIPTPGIFGRMPATKPLQTESDDVHEQEPSEKRSLAQWVRWLVHREIAPPDEEENTETPLMAYLNKQDDDLRKL